VHTLIEHDVADWDGKNSDKLSLETSENLVIDAAGHRWRVLLLVRKDHLETNDCIDGRIRA
jgi:hypothetical protein